jgi:C4-dicarboxylate transporter DctM subunit
MIPPSNAFVIIGILAEISIGKLYMAGIIPGILQVLFYMAVIYLLCWFNPRLGRSVHLKIPLKQKLMDTFRIWPVLILFIAVLGGIYGGFFTATEAGAIGAFLAFLIPLIRKQWTRGKIYWALLV